MFRLLLILMLCSLPSILYSQIDLEAYKNYMKNHQDISYEDMLDEFDVGTFDRYSPTDYSKAYYFDSTNQFMNFTQDELDLIEENGFVVTQRKEVQNFIKGYYDIYVNDLPVYISADLFNHALFYSMTQTIKYLEERVVNEMLTDILTGVNTGLKSKFNASQNEDYRNAFRDLDVIICVARNLQFQSAYFATPNFAADSIFSQNITNDILSSVANNNGSMVDIKLPSGFVLEKVDLSQFKPRGHYDTNELRRYFMSMMWLGRLFLTIPEDEEEIEDNKSSIIMSGIIADIINEPTLKTKYDALDDFLEFFISKQNNLTVEEAAIVYKKLKVTDMIEVLEKNLLKDYCRELRATEQGVQLYNTQCVYEYEFEDDGQSPQYFSMLGQRPTVDAFVFGNVVFPMIQGGTRRMLPESMDILFALGNDAAYHLLENHLNAFGYETNIASCRYLFDNMNDKAWESSLYNLWIQALRTLNPPKDRSNLPNFMQAAAWQHKNMNTQLSSWAELRHLTVLYVKQSYTGIPICDFPDFFIGPNAEYFEILAKLNSKIIELLTMIYQYSHQDLNIFMLRNSFEIKQEIFEKMESFAEKQQQGKSLADEDIAYLKNMVFVHNETCVHDNKVIEGWIYDLFNLSAEVVPYNAEYPGESLKPTKVTTDVHTSPSDEFENIVGWVKHAATGDQNFCSIVTNNCNGNLTTYTGVVNSYYEYVTDDFQRDTDEEWLAKMDQIPSPSFTNIYLADKNGYREDIAELVRTHDVSVEDRTEKEKYSIEIYPNVFEDEFTISIQSKEDFEGVAQIAMYSSSGELVFKAQYNNLPNGQIMINPANYGLSNLNAGVYIIELKLGDNVYSGKAIKIK